MTRRGRDAQDLAELAALYFSRGRRSDDDAVEADAVEPRDGSPRALLPAPRPATPPPAVGVPERLLVLGCPAGERSYRVAVSLVVHLVRSGHRAGLIELGPTGGVPIPVPRLRVPMGSWSGAPPRLAGRELRLLGRGLRTMESIVVHGAGVDGPLQRVLALGARRAVIVPSPVQDDPTPVLETLRACLEGSHRLRVAVVGDVPLPFRGERRVAALGLPESFRPSGLPTEWGDWLGPAPGETPPLLDPPWRAVRLLA